MRSLIKRNGQSTLEYTILIAVVIAGLIAMQAYVKRGFQGRLKSSSDDLGEQYSPGLTESSHTSIADRSTTETVSGGVTTTEVNSQTQSRTGYEEIAPLADEYWPE